MIELFSANTPNGWKISIMLEEIGYEYKVTKVDLGKEEQLKPEFKKISPFGKIPVIIDHENNKSIFESGAILMYLADKSGKLYDEKDRLVINQWLMAQMGTVGPMIGQHHQFHHYNPGKSEFGEERYFKITKRIYAVGDICNYPGKLKLILSGFHEGALAARACFKLARPNEKYRFEFTTTSSNLLKRLGKKE